ncbi:MAG: alpha-L-fucosidase [Capsulimonadaceae bacterium]|nr:alpha-L-fucosidase [Capsulimonadaceae bacterium]
MTYTSPVPTAIPTVRQLEYQDWEFGIFVHFGVRTFNEGHRDWDGKPMDAKTFNPSELDCDQWARTAVDAGAKYMVLTAKHHDGFANWPSKYTDFSVARSPWRNGKGDVVRDYVDACRRHGLKVGLYYSPADASGSNYADPKAYDDYFIGQISEILEPYGKIDILWFDGCGSEGHNYDWPRITSAIRQMQPEILIFNMGDPNFRWIGNEAGIGPWPLWNTVDSLDFSVNTTEKEKLASGPIWLSAESDCMMRDVNWFYSDQDEHTVKTVSELLGIYYRTVGRGANLLMNIGPDRRGVFPDLDSARIKGLAAELRRRFAKPIVTLADAEVSSDCVSWTFPGTTRLDHVIVQEDLTAGEHIRRFAIEVEGFPHSAPIPVWEGRNVGHKAICAFPLIRAKKVHVRILEADGAWTLRDAALYQTEE